MSTVVTSKGQVTIPKKVRDYLGIAPGAAVDFDLLEDGRVTVRKAGKRRSPKRSAFARVRGRASAGMSTDEIMALTRGDA
ncbi:MAG: AbrB/MazE/SpoVT family DNA-binding domain-containing protein [Dongiaceae bacterium]